MNDPPLIALHIGDLSPGGAERVCLTLARGFLARGYAVDLVVCRARGALLADLPSGVRLVDLRARGSIWSLPALTDYLRARRPVALIANLVPQNTIAVLAGRLAARTFAPPVRIFVVQHAALSREAKYNGALWSKAAPWLYRLVLPMAAGVIAVSQGVADDLERVMGFSARQVRVIHNPIQIDMAQRQGAQALDDPFFDTEDAIIVAAGRLVAQKGFHTLIDAFAILCGERAARLAICGAGPLENTLRAQIRRRGLESRVKLLGFQPNPYRYMARADVFVLSSSTEGFGNVLVEAMACGAPVASTNCPYGPAEILDGGAFGALTPVGDAGALAAGVGRTLDRPLPRDTLIARARTFEADHAISRYLDLLGLPPNAPGEAAKS